MKMPRVFNDLVIKLLLSCPYSVLPPKARVLTPLAGWIGVAREKAEKAEGQAFQAAPRRKCGRKYTPDPSQTWAGGRRISEP